MSTEKALQKIPNPNPTDPLELYKKFCPDHDFGLSPEGEKKLRIIFAREKMAPNTVCMTCPGNENVEANCIWARRGECPFLQADPDINLPKGLPCPHEMNLYLSKAQALMDGICLSDPDGQCTPSEQLQCQKIAQQDILIARVERDLSRRPDATIFNPVGGPSGADVEREEINPAYDTLSKLERQRNAIQRELRQEVANRLKFVKVRKVDIEAQTIRAKIQESTHAVSLPDNDSGPKPKSMIGRIKKDALVHEEKIEKIIGDDLPVLAEDENDNEGPVKLEL